MGPCSKSCWTCVEKKAEGHSKRSRCQKVIATARGLEPLRAEPNGILVHHLNHSVTLSLRIYSNDIYITMNQSCRAQPDSMITGWHTFPDHASIKVGATTAQQCINRDSEPTSPHQSYHTCLDLMANVGAAIVQTYVADQRPGPSATVLPCYHHHHKPVNAGASVPNNYSPFRIPDPPPQRTVGMPALLPTSQASTAKRYPRLEMPNPPPHRTVGTPTLL